MKTYAITLLEIDPSMNFIAGGKGASLGELSRIQNINVPEGFCVTKAAYKKITGNNQELKNLLDELIQLTAVDRKVIHEIGERIRKTIESIPILTGIVEEIETCITKLGENNAYAIRSSATAEDLPTASFAGQQDTYLNITSKKSILQHISKCWASLFTDRAIIYRIQNGFDHRHVYLSVIVQKMIFPEASGILFTADPITSNRKMISIDASYRLGEALVSGLVSADNYKVQGDKIAGKLIAQKKLAIYGFGKAGTITKQIDPRQQKIQTLTDPQILELAGIGRKIDTYFGYPQDIEWCLAVGYFILSRAGQLLLYTRFHR